MTDWLSASLDVFGQAAPALGLRAWDRRMQSLRVDLLDQHRHGDLTRWAGAVSALPDVPAVMDASGRFVRLDSPQTPGAERLIGPLETLMPWRKGPYQFFGVEVDTEWRSDLKWDRLAPCLGSLSGQLVLDVGCGSGYHMWRMQAAGARAVVGVDPTMLYWCQFLALWRYQAAAPLYFLPTRLERLPLGNLPFDRVFSMGLLYHQRAPVDHVQQLHRCLVAGGQLVLETLVIDQPGHEVLTPLGRYARMKNVWFIPAPSLVERWLARAGFTDIRLLDMAPTGVEEQRATRWMDGASLADALDPDHPGRTIEGEPAPVRAIWSARKG